MSSGKTSLGSTRAEFDKKISVKPQNVCKRVASKIGSIVSMDKLFSLDTDLTQVIDLLSLQGTYVVLIMDLVDSEQIKKSITNAINVWHTILPKFLNRDKIISSIGGYCEVWIVDLTF
jgi:hypothetical protein